MRNLFRADTFRPVKGHHKGKLLRFCRYVPGTPFVVGRLVDSGLFGTYHYVHSREICSIERIGLDDTFSQRLQVRLWVKLTLLKLDLAGASPFMELDEEGNEYLVALRPRVAKLLFPGVVIKQGFQTQDEVLPL